MLLVGGVGAIGGIAGDRIIEFADRRGRIGLQFGLGDAFFLEVDLIEEMTLLCVQHVDNVDEGILALGHVGYGQSGHGAEAVRVQERAVPGDGRAPVMADDDRRAVGRERGGKAGHVGGHVLHVIGLDFVRLVRAAIAAHIGGGDAVAGLAERFQLVAPGIPALGKAMHQDD